jgi:hypothetical protein
MTAPAALPSLRFQNSNFMKFGRTDSRTGQHSTVQCHRSDHSDQCVRGQHNYCSTTVLKLNWLYKDKKTVTQYKQHITQHLSSKARESLIMHTCLNACDNQANHYSTASATHSIPTSHPPLRHPPRASPYRRSHRHYSPRLRS